LSKRIRKLLEQTTDDTTTVEESLACLVWPMSIKPSRLSGNKNKFPAVNINSCDSQQQQESAVPSHQDADRH